MRKGDGADGQRAKVVGNFTTDQGEDYGTISFSKERKQMDRGQWGASAQMMQVK